MKIKDKVKPKQPPIPPAMYAGICVGIIDLGEQYSEMFKSYSNKVVIVWELPGVTVEVDGKQEPRQLSRTYTLAANKKSNLRKLLTGWNGVQYSDEAFGALDLFDQLGKPCFLNIVLNDTGEYNNIETVTPIAAGFPVPTTTTPFIKWDMDAWNDADFEALPDWAKDKIKKSTQYQKAHPPTTVVDFPAQTSQTVQQAAPQVVQQSVQPAQTSQAVYTSAPAAPGAVNPQAYQMPAQQFVSTQSAPTQQREVPF